jgi:RNA polymerase sigma factor (sigma-70 family)
LSPGRFMPHTRGGWNRAGAVGGWEEDAGGGPSSRLRLREARQPKGAPGARGATGQEGGPRRPGGERDQPEHAERTNALYSTAAQRKPRYGKRMRDSEVVASIVAGEADGLAEAYDRYADPLYKYCEFMLGDAADAADAVQDTFVIAASRLAGLGDTELLRAWLYAVARNECLRILGAKTTTTAPAEALEVTGDSADAGDQVERAGLQALIEDAAAGVNPPEREIIELHLWQGLDAAEIAALLGLSPGHARSLLSAATEQLEASLVVLAVGRASPADCAVLAHMLGGWDGKLTPELRWWVYPHIKRCGTCGARRAMELRPAALAGLTPAAAMAAGAAESLTAAAGPPEALREHTLALAAGESPSATAHRAAVLGRIAPFGVDGFPKPLQAPKAGLLHGAAQGAWLSSPRRQAAAAAGAVLAVAIAAAGLALSGNNGHSPVAGGKPTATGPSAPLATATTPAAGAGSPPRSQPPPTPTRRGSSQSPKAKPPATQQPAGVPTTSAPSPTPASVATTSAPSPTPTTAHPTPPPSPKPRPSAATLAVSPSGGTIRPGWTAITLTAEGGTVHWSITVPSHSVWASQSSGTVSPGGGPVHLWIWASHHAVGQRVTISPGGTVFTIAGGGFAAADAGHWFLVI